MGYYPVFLDLHRRDCLVIGGGEVATDKIRALLDAGAKITVIAPEATEQIHFWHQQGALSWIRRHACPEDMRLPKTSFSMPSTNRNTATSSLRRLRKVVQFRSPSPRRGAVPCWLSNYATGFGNIFSLIRLAH